MKQERLHPEESVIWAHGTLMVSTAYIHTFAISMIFISISLYCFSSNFVVATDNYKPLNHLFIAEYTNETQVFYDEVIKSMNSKHPLHMVMYKDDYRYTFGNIFKNYCFLYPYPEGVKLPSILRKMSFSAQTQSMMRAAVLVSITTRMAVNLFRNADIMVHNTLKSSQIRFLSWICTISDLLTSIFGLFTTCLQGGLDSPRMAFLVFYSLPLFGISFFASGVAYTMIEYYDLKKKNTRVYLRFICLTIFAFCLPAICRDYHTFQATRPCLIHVNWAIAVCEYTCVVCIVVFYMTQIADFKLMQMVFSTERVETACCMDYIDVPDYKPAMLNEMVDEQQFSEEFLRLKSIITEKQ